MFVLFCAFVCGLIVPWLTHEPRWIKLLIDIGVCNLYVIVIFAGRLIRDWKS